MSADRSLWYETVSRFADCCRAVRPHLACGSGRTVFEALPNRDNRSDTQTLRDHEMTDLYCCFICPCYPIGSFDLSTSFRTGLSVTVDINNGTVPSFHET